MVVSSDDVDRVTVLGAGNMGHGITEVVALAGYDVVMRDIERAFVDDGYEDISWSLDKLAENDLIDQEPADVLARIETTTDLAEAAADADLVIEAAPERLDLKHEIFGELDEVTHDEAILATNTSSLSITKIAEATDRPEQVLGLHFFNPPVKMDLVEVIHGEETGEASAAAGYEFVESIGKTPIHVRKDVQGFVVNSVLGPFMGEPVWMVSEGEAEIREADATMVFERGYPMGPFELADMNGIDIGYHVRTEAGIPIPPLMAEKAENDELGRKTGRGYYDYAEGDGADYDEGDVTGEFDHRRVEAIMVNEAAKLVGDDVATPEAVDTGMQLGAGFPEGVCERADDVGLDEILAKLEALHEAKGDARYEPADYLVDLVESGEGFYG